MTNQTHPKSSRALKTIKIDEHVHAWLVLIAEKYDLTLSASIEKLISDHEQEVVKLHSDIRKLKQRRLTRHD